MLSRIALLLACLALSGAVLAEDVIPHSSITIGGDVDINKATDGPIFAAGGNVIVEAPVNGSLHAAGGTIRLESASVISGDVAVAGGTVDVDGTLKGKLRAAGGDVRINGPIAGDAFIAAGTLVLGPQARIDGKLTFRGGELRQDPDAQVNGGVEHMRRNAMRHHERTFGERLLRGWFWIAGLMVLAALIAAALPGASQRMARELRERPWITPLIGFLALTSIPIAAVLLMITIIGIPLGILAFIGYAALLLVGYVWLSVVVGGMLLERVRPDTAARTAWRVGAAALTMLAIALLTRIPFVGGTFRFAALAIGVGMIVAAILHRSRPEEAPAAA
jgi:Integral membrane protein CcmA involved in cell shape determination